MMTEKRLQEIQAMLDHNWTMGETGWMRVSRELLAEVERLQHENLVLMAREARETWKTIPVEGETDGELIAQFWTTFAETHGDRPDLVATAKRYAEEALNDD